MPPPDERREGIWQRLENIADRLAKLEGRREADAENREALASAVLGLTREMQAVALKLNTIETQRNTMLAVAGGIGAAVTMLGKGLFSLLFGGGVK